jgi:hypothetical protein
LTLAVTALVFRAVAGRDEPEPEVEPEMGEGVS